MIGNTQDRAKWCRKHDAYLQDIYPSVSSNMVISGFLGKRFGSHIWVALVMPFMAPPLARRQENKTGLALGVSVRSCLIWCPRYHKILWMVAKSCTIWDSYWDSYETRRKSIRYLWEVDSLPTLFLPFETAVSSRFQSICRILWRNNGRNEAWSSWYLYKWAKKHKLSIFWV